jgi:hypothetical protein
MRLIITVIRFTVDDIGQIIHYAYVIDKKDPLESIDSGDKVGKVFKEIFEIEE